MSDEVHYQYATYRNLSARGSFQGKYATVGWFGWLIDTMAFPAGSNILDIGCGPAWFWRAGAERMPPDLSITLLDSSPGMIKEAKANLSKIEPVGDLEFHNADAVALPCANDAFDIVLLLHVLYHVSDPRKALMEAWRVLRPGGKVFVSTNALDNMNELHVLGAKTYGGSGVDPGAALFSLDSAESLVSVLFSDMRRYDLTDEMACTDPIDAARYLLSMPPGNNTSDEECKMLDRYLRNEFEHNDGVLRVSRRNGLVEGTKPA